jgi:hypothetical protein
MADDVQVKWFDLSRFEAALKVVPLSPLRGVALTCLEVIDQDAFTKHVHGDAQSGTEKEASAKAWREQIVGLGFGTHPEYFASGGESERRGFRLYSVRTTFSLSELRRIVPGVTAQDYKLMPVGRIVHRVDVDPEMAAGWKQFTETVLAKEAVGVWVPRVNPYDKPFAQARTMREVWDAHTKDDKHKVVASPTSAWLVNQLDKVQYRETALVAYYADQQAAMADGYSPADLVQADLPYALPLIVGKNGRITAVRDVRHLPEVLCYPPHNLFGSVSLSGGGIVVPALREMRNVEAAYREEAAKWREWKEAGGAIEAAELEASMRRVVEADAGLCDCFSNVSSGQVDELVDGNRWNGSDQPRSMKALADWKQDDYRVFGLRAKRYVGDGAADDVYGNLVELDARVRQQIAARAKEAAKEELRKVAASVQETAATKEPVRHEDAGEKIGGARKDFHLRAMTQDDLESMNDYERNSLVVKKNVWPPLDYEAMRAAGVTPQAAVAIKYLKDSLAVEPDRSHSKSENPEADYIKAIGAVRDVMAEVKTQEAFAQACMKLYDLGREGTTYIYGGTAMQVQWGSDACELLCNSVASYGWGDKVRVEAVTPTKIHDHIAKKVREGSEWNYLIKPKRERSEAEREAEAERSEQERTLHRPHLEVVERTGGEDWRGGRDITADDLLSHFGFRAVEFGNWLPQDERQTVLNMAFDSLCDLADALGLPPQGISFNGELAVAFGSRGRGGKHAALAHYEPGRDVINLTRMKGAGTLAHEWFHALDWHLGEKTAYLTERQRPRFDGDPMIALVAALKKSALMPEELASLSRQNAEQGRDNAVSWCYVQSTEARSVIKSAVDELFERARMRMYDEAVQKFSRLSDHEKKLANNPQALGRWGAVNSGTRADLLEQIVDAMRAAADNKAAFRKVCDKIDGNIDWMLANMGRWMTIEAAHDTGVVLDDRFLGGENGRETAFVQQALALDKTRSKPYWSTDVEMFARAGAQFVHYALAEKGVRSDYLVYGSEEARYEDHPIGNPNPTGVDRLALRPHFEALVEDYRIRFVRSMETEAVMEP